MLMYRCTCGKNANCPVCQPNYEPIPCDCDGIVHPPEFLTVGPADYTAIIMAIFASAMDEHDITFLQGPWAETLCDWMDWDYEACRNYAALTRRKRRELIRKYRMVGGHR